MSVASYRRPLVIVGSVALGLAVFVLVAPALPLLGWFPGVSPVLAQIVMVLLMGALLLFVYSLPRDRAGAHNAAARFPGRRETSSSTRLSSRAEISDTGGVIGEEIDSALDALDGGQTESSRYRSRNEVRDRLRETAQRVLVESESISPAEARRRIDEGTWTESPRAAAFLGGETAPAVPPELRLVDWLHGERDDRRARAALVAIAERSNAETAVTAP